ncbi:hypothetical protein BDF20DRAFT_855423, partial [Mycotypha africana]|uniref:uncharacterized protein n=1 Tax=Mycotypha africana TaxID=64632 RepID=UPI002301B186
MSFGLQHVGKKRKKGMTTTELENIQNDQPLRQRTKNDCLENKSRIPFTVSTFSATSRPVLALRSGCGKPPLLSNTVFVVPALITLKGLYKHPTFYTSPSVATEITLFAYKQIFGKTSLTTTTVTSVPSSSASTIPPLSSSSTPVKLITMYEHNKKTSNKPLSHSKPSHSATTAPLKRTETTMGAATKRLYEPTPIEQLLSNNSHPKFLPTSVPVKKIKMCGNPPPTDKLSMNDVNKSTHLSTASAIKTVPMTDNSMKHTPKASLSAPTMITTTTTTAAAAAAA